MAGQEDRVPTSETQQQERGLASGPASEQWLEETLDKVFLTPRVVDERAFDELSGSLKTLVKDAGAQSRALIATTGEVKLLGDQLREATRELQTRVETAVKVIPTLDQRVAKAEQLLDLTGKELATRVSELREATTKGVSIDRERLAGLIRAETSSLIEDVVKEQMGELRRRMAEGLGEVQKEADAKAAAIVERVRTAQESLDRTLEATDAKARSISELLDGLVARGIERAKQGSERAVVRATEALADPLTRVADTISTIEDGITRGAAAQAAIESAAKDAGLRLGAAISEADRRAEAIGIKAAERIGELRREALLVVEIAAGTKAEEILAVVEDTVGAAARAEEKCRELRELVVAAGELTKLSGSFEAAGAGIETLTARLTQLRTDYEALTSQADAGLEANVRQMGAWLSNLLAQGDQIGRGLDRLIKQANAAVAGGDPSA
jgi:hypothetical protein